MEDDCGASPATNPSCIYGPVRLYAYGQNQRVVDCRFEGVGMARPQYGGIVLSYNQAWHEVDPNRDMSLPYQELTMEDTVFEVSLEVVVEICLSHTAAVVFYWMK